MRKKDNLNNLQFEYVKDPIYGYITLFEHELMLINSTQMQRLRRIKQLPTAHFVYPSATHNRLSHSIGAMHLAGQFTETLLDPFLKENKINPVAFQQYVLLMRLWGLTHDIGHGPFGHTFDSAVLRFHDLDHERMGARMLMKIPELVKCFKKITGKTGIELDDLTRYMTTQDEEAKYDKTIGQTEYDESVLLWLLRGVYSADTMDFTLRDSYFTGAGYGNFDWQRLILSSKIQNGKIMLDKRAEEALDSFLLGRLLMFSTVYYHRTSRLLDRISSRLLEKKRGFFKPYVQNPEKYCELDEDSIFTHQEIRNTKEAEILIKRHIPYKMEKNIPIQSSSDDARNGMLVSLLEGLEDMMRSKLKLRPDSFIVDIPMIRLNPMKYGKNVTLFDASTGKEELRSVVLTSWGEKMPSEVRKIRLYIKKALRAETKEKIRTEFDFLISRRTESDSTYY